MANSAADAQSTGQYSKVGAGHAESLLLTDLDYFEAEIEKCRQRLAKNQLTDEAGGPLTIVAVHTES